MAAAAPPELQCVICHDLLSDPVILNCSHNACSRCASRVTGPILTCPLCQTPTPVGEWKKNTALTALLAMFRPSGGGALTLRQSPVPPSPMPDVRVLAPSRMCPEHDKELELYCMEDRVIVCSHCMIFGAHKGHSCIKFPEAVAQSTPGILDDLRRQEVFVEQLHDRKNCVTQRLELCRQSETDAIQQVEEQFNTLQQLLNKRKGELLLELRAVRDEKVKILSQMGEHLDKTIVSCTEGITNVRQAMDRNNPSRSSSWTSSSGRTSSSLPARGMRRVLLHGGTLARMMERFGIVEAVQPREQLCMPLSADGAPAGAPAGPGAHPGPATTSGYRELAWVRQAPPYHGTLPGRTCWRCPRWRAGPAAGLMEQYVAIQEHCARAMQTFARGYEAPTEPQNVFMNLWPRPKRIAQQMEAQYTRLAQQIRSARPSPPSS
ncbi:putative tripartite motif-containing protein 10 [Paratrimastix pyriformis]|uniref:Tripartite motif-containing protein 10 n=1 Tax=Paratrimastix pyriformis TaxID=342808 RepID=A0ABQ8USV0_9EUKA|nr:putative tripartite motif-containing protein 10 [Paratrimastix pyriformis]